MFVKKTKKKQNMNHEENKLDGLFSYYIFRIYKRRSEIELKEEDTY